MSKTIEKDIKSSYNVNIYSIKCDISLENDVKSLTNFVKDKTNKIDVLVNNAGIAIDNLLEEKTVEEFKKVIDTNLIGTFSVVNKCN